MLVAHILLLVSSLVAASDVVPLIIPPSLVWDGDDGQWSSFYVSVGTPPQNIRVLPGTSSEASTILWTVIPEGCNDVNPTLTDCTNKRGGVFQHLLSTSWSTKGLENHADGAIYSLPIVEESHLGIAGNGSYGYETIGLGLGKSNLPVLTDQLIAGIWTDDFFLGTLPLSPWPFNFSFSEPVPSMLDTLRNQSLIPSLSWAYTAGAVYQDTTTHKFGSLTLGGYDASRFKANNVSFSFGSDYTRDLLLKLTSITYDTVSSTPLLTQSINVFIDSLISELWLPVSVCEQFAKAFNLTYNTQGNLYLIDDEAHTALLAQNPTFTFTLSNGNSDVDIVLPYAAFDLSLTMPIVGNTTRYFPIKQGQNESQYVLGRTFMQEAYVIADFERKNFSVSQALFPSTSVDPDIVPIQVVGYVQGGKTALGIAAIVGIVVGTVAFLVLIVVVWFLIRRRRRSKARNIDQASAGMLNDCKIDDSLSSSGNPSFRVEAQSAAVHEMQEHGNSRLELLTKANAHELENQQSHGELEGEYKQELAGNEPLYELDGRWRESRMRGQRQQAVELDAT